MMADRSLGKRGEAIAAEYLEAHGYRVLDLNYRYERGEIDIVCYDPDPVDGAPAGEIVFVEVKTRSGESFGRPEDAVTPEKQQRIVAVSRAYLYENRMDGAPCRFDVVSVRLSDARPNVVHFKDAFWS